MPLLDHFHPPLSLERHWESFHATWAGSLADTLSRQVPTGSFADQGLHGLSRLRDARRTTARAAPSAVGRAGDASGPGGRVHGCLSTSPPRAMTSEPSP